MYETYRGFVLIPAEDGIQVTRWDFRFRHRVAGVREAKAYIDALISMSFPDLGDTRR